MYVGLDLADLNLILNLILRLFENAKFKMKIVLNLR
jgi:hypothetical protein